MTQLHAPQTWAADYVSPIGRLRLRGTDGGLLSVAYVEDGGLSAAPLPPLAQRALDELEEYFRGTRQCFTVSMLPHGTPFQRRVWDALRRVPFGMTTTYQALADAIANPSSCRAVGSANMRNPLAIMIPCHRVLGKDGNLVGYAGGLWRKTWLLQHECARLL